MDKVEVSTLTLNIKFNNKYIYIYKIRKKKQSFAFFKWLILFIKHIESSSLLSIREKNNIEIFRVHSTETIQVTNA